MTRSPIESAGRDAAISESTSEEPLQLPSWPLRTLAFEKPATICKKSDHTGMSRPRGGALEDKMSPGERLLHAVIQGPWLLTPVDLPSFRGP